MDKDIKIVGVDVSKLKLDVYGEEEGYHQFSNTAEGFKNLLDVYGESSHYVMESTGCYHVLLALYLGNKGIKVSVENPLKIKRFIHLSLRNKI